MAARIITLTILLLLIDVFAFQAVRHLAGPLAKNTRILLYSLYWAIPLLSLAYIISGINGWNEHFPKGVKVTIQALIFILYFAKLIMAVVIIIDDVRRLLFGALNLGFKEWDLSTGRSKWMAYSALILGAIPVLSLTYGMARNPYRYKVIRTPVKIKNLPSDLHGLRIAQISDIHSGSFFFEEPVERSIDMQMAE
jgi:hypothetical protein